MERTRLAKERTFAAWIRTGLATLAIGLGLVKLLPGASPRWLIQAIGILLVFTGMAVFIVGYQTYERVLQRLQQEGYEGVSARVIKVLTALMVLAGILALILICLD